MSSGIEIEVFPSQYPEALTRARWRSLEVREVDGRLHYEGYRQTRKWIALTEAFAPIYRDARCVDLYETMYQKSARRFLGSNVELVALGCGRAEKEKAALAAFHREGATISRVTLCDCGMEMLVSARLNLKAVAPKDTRSVAFDILDESDVNSALGRARRAGARRFVTCFGVTPNAEPNRLAASLRRVAGPDDLVLISANLVDIASDSRRALALEGYDNDLTRDWLFGFLDDVGVDRDSGAFEFYWEIEQGFDGRARIRCDWVFHRPIKIQTPKPGALGFVPGDRLQIFYSYRYTLSGFEKWLLQERCAVLSVIGSDANDEALALIRVE